VRGIGKRGKAVRFDGKVDFIRVPRNEGVEPEVITVAAWVRFRDGEADGRNDGIRSVFFKRNTSFHDNEDYCLELHPGHLLRTDLSSPFGGHVKLTTRESLAPELWHHLAITVGGGEARIYVDGKLAVARPHSYPFDHNRQADLLVGARDHASYPMDRYGAFDLFELKIWNEVLESERIAALYRARAGQFGVARPEDNQVSERESSVADISRKHPARPGRPVLHYAFEQGGEWGPGAVVKDLSGNGHDGKVEGDGLEVVQGIGKRGKAVRFDGKGDYIRVPRDAAFEGQEVTVAAWVKIQKESMWEAGVTIVFKRNSSFHHNEGYCLDLYPDRTARVTVAGPSAAQGRVQSTVPMANDIWHHVAMAYAPGDTRLYIDGTLAGHGEFPQMVVHNQEADLLIAGRDHAEYPMGSFGMFDLAEVKVWNEALDAEAIARLHAERVGHPGVGEAESDWKPLSEFGAERRLTWRGVSPERLPSCGGNISVDKPRVFPPWKPGMESFKGEAGLAAELQKLVVQGKRDRAASPEFLGALEGLLEKYGETGDGNEEKPSGKLPLQPDFKGPGMPPGWSAVNPAVWGFGDREARQVESRANTRYVLFYEPGMAWRDYEVRVRFESDKWFPPPANSCAAVWVRYKGVDDAYCVNFDGNGNVSVISCEQGGKGRVIVRTAAGPEVVKDGKPWTVRVRGEEMVVEHEGRRYLEVHDGTHREGTVGLESIHIPMRFSGVEVK
jgi:hypothetical protein